MEIDLATCRLTTPVTHDESGVTAYLLTERVAPLQQGFYFVNDSMSSDGRYLWFYTASPPSAGRAAAVVDFENCVVSRFFDTQFGSASPFVDVESGRIYWGSRESVYSRKPGRNGSHKLVNSLPAELVGSRSVTRLATHLTRSADGKEFFIDAALGLQWVMGSLPVDGGEFELWHRFDRNFNHAQFSPTDPDLVLFAMENHPDPITGITLRITDRMWTIRRGGQPRPVFDEPTVVTHEWWDRGGAHVWCVEGSDGVWRVKLDGAEVEKVWHLPGAWHAHDHPSGRYVVADRTEKFHRGCPSTVHFLNRDTGREIEFVSNPEMGGVAGSKYHIDPHPRFCGGGEYVVFTTTVRGEVDVALVKTSDLVDKTS